MKLQLTLTTLLVSLPTLAQTTLTDADLQGAYTTRTYSKRIVCHDPSVFMDTIGHSKDNPRYLIYGSHLGAGYTSATDNYQQWTSFGGGETGSCTLFTDLNGNRVTYSNAYNNHAIKKVKNCEGVEVDFGNFNAHSWQKKGNNVQGMEWAPDVIWNPTMQKWLMYMSINGDNWCSSIVCMTADNAQGPWTYQGPVVFSGFMGSYEHNGFNATNDYKHTDLEIAIGTQTSLPSRYAKGSSWGSYWPNCIDPCVFYDTEGKLWMSYGSWSGGIFMFELDETNGLRDYTVKYESKFSSGSDYRNCTEDPYYGKKIAGGWYNSGEASYIQRIGDYYYLFMSYGGLSGYGDYWATGYQMRIFRSETPDGPYKDCLTTNGHNATFSSAFTDFGSNTSTDYGVRLMSCYKWDPMPYAEIAQGHNSAIVDHKGRALVVYHTRQNNNTEGHSVRVHQLFQNQDGWLVSAPYEFDGEEVTQQEIASQQLYTTDEVAGDYQLIFHKYRQDAASQEHELPINATLHADGTVTGTYTGTWELVSGTSYINLSLKGSKTANKQIKFGGVLTRQTIDYTNIPALCFTAISSSDGSPASGVGSSYQQTRGLCLWGSKADAKAAIKYTADKTSISPTVTTDLTLPAGKLGADIVWTSSNESVITSDGKVKGKGSATLTATISKDGYCYSKSYNVNVNAESTPVYLPECGSTDCSAGWWTAFSSTYTIARGKQAEFKFYNYNDGGSNWDNWVLVCTNGKDSHGGGGAEYFVIRADAYGWGNNNFSDKNISNDYNWSSFMSDMDGSLNEIMVKYETNGKVTMSATITTTTGDVYHESYYQSNVTAQNIGIFFTVEKAYISSTGPNGESLGIDEVRLSPIESEHYDLFGRRIDASRPGLHIIDSRKIIVR